MRRLDVSTGCGAEVSGMCVISHSLFGWFVKTANRSEQICLRLLDPNSCILEVGKRQIRRLVPSRLVWLSSHSSRSSNASSDI